jgi:tetratricopeptide (TPR) repeat protein
MLGNNSSAVASLDSALTYKPDIHEAWFNRGASLFSMDRYDEALTSINKALERKPNYSDYLRFRQAILDIVKQDSVNTQSNN